MGATRTIYVVDNNAGVRKSLARGPNFCVNQTARCHHETVVMDLAVPVNRYLGYT